MIDIVLNFIHFIYDNWIAYTDFQYEKIRDNLTNFTGPGYIWLYLYIIIRFYRKFYL